MGLQTNGQHNITPTCNSIAMGLVALQMGMLFTGIAAVKSNPQLLHKTFSWRGTALAFLLMIGGIWGLTTQKCEVLSWSCFTAGAIVLGMQFGRYENEALRRGLAQTSVLLVLAASLAPFVGYFSEATDVLLLFTLGLLVGLIGLVIWPSAPLEAALSVGGSALFAVWTVHDVTKRPCESPWLKSVEVFLDIFNLFAFSVN